MQTKMGGWWDGVVMTEYVSGLNTALIQIYILPGLMGVSGWVDGSDD